MSSCDRTPIVLKVPPGRIAAGLLFFCFFGLVILLLGMAGAEGILCAVGGGLILAGILWSLYRRGEEIVFEADQVVVKTRFSREMYPYEGMNFLLRRSWTVTFHRGLTAGGGLAGVAIQLRRGKRAEVTVPAARFDGRALREAIDFLSQLPNPKRYL